MMVFSVPISLQIPLKLPDVCSSTSNTSHEEMKQTALKRVEEQVQTIVNHLNETMTDPFDIEAHPPCLMHISTGMHATREVHDSLLSAVNEGEEKCRNFVNSALSVGQSVSFYSPISKSKLKTFEHMNAKTSLKCKSDETGENHFRTASLDLIYKISSLYHLHGTWTPG
jgi:hypothetical protein